MYNDEFRIKEIISKEPDKIGNKVGNKQEREKKKTNQKEKIERAIASFDCYHLKKKLKVLIVVEGREK